MFCIFLLHVKGGGKSIHGKTIEECKANCKKNCLVFPGSYVLATEPYEMVPAKIQFAKWDSSVPKEIFNSWSEEDQKLYFKIKD
jgi:hypothetical protein